MPTESTGGRRQRRLLILSVISLVLTLVTLVLAITEPGWLSWLRVGVAICVSTTFISAYRQRRTP